MNVPIEAVDNVDTVSVEVPEPVNNDTELGFSANVTLPSAGVSVAFRLTLPAKLFRLVNCIEKLVSDPCEIIWFDGDACIMKSGNFEPPVFVAWLNVVDAKNPEAIPSNRMRNMDQKGKPRENLPGAILILLVTRILLWSKGRAVFLSSLQTPIGILELFRSRATCVWRIRWKSLVTV